MYDTRKRNGNCPVKHVTLNPPKRVRDVSKQTREFEIVDSDRCRMMYAANDLVSHMVTKQVLPLAMSSIPTECEMMDCEQSAYEAALGFLTRQFDIGYREVEPYTKRTEYESESEIERA